MNIKEFTPPWPNFDPGLPVLTGSLLIFAATILAGCQSLSAVDGGRAVPDSGQGPGKVDAGPTQDDEAYPGAPRPAPDAEEIRALLDQAEDALAGGQLLSPAGGSALLLFDRVLALDPENEAAQRGMERITQHFLDAALNAAGKRRFEQARAKLAQARLVDPQHPGIAPTEEQIDLLSSARRRIISLDGALLKSRDPLLLETLRRAGLQSRAQGCRTIIHARNDPEGRWIYQQMSSAPGSDERIRANLQISWPPRIEILCFTEPRPPAS